MFVYRCFSGILHTSERQAPVLKCLSFFAETFGEDTINKLLIPKAEGMVSSHIMCRLVSVSSADRILPSLVYQWVAVS